jgi:hypothetical protein
MAIENAQVSVGTTATKLSTSTAIGSGPSNDYNIRLSAGTAFYIGGSSAVTTANGYQVPANTHFEVPMEYGEELWGIVGTGTVTVSVLRAGIHKIA